MSGESGRAIDGNRQVIARSELHDLRIFVAHHGHHDRYGADEQQHEDEPDQKHRLRGNGGQVDFRAGDDEEQRNQEPVPDGVELRFQAMVSFRNDVAENEACSERAQHDVEAEKRRKRNEHDEQQHGHAHERLRGGLAPFEEDAVDTAVRLGGLVAETRDQNGNGHEPDKNSDGLPCSARREQKRHGKHRPELTPGAVGENGASDARFQQAAFFQDGHKRADGGRGERNGDGEAVHAPRGDAGERVHGNKGKPKRNCPGDKPAFSFASRDGLGVDFVACEQEEHSASQFGEQLDAFVKPDDVDH